MILSLKFTTFLLLIIVFGIDRMNSCITQVIFGPLVEIIFCSFYIIMELFFYFT